MGRWVKWTVTEEVAMKEMIEDVLKAAGTEYRSVADGDSWKVQWEGHEVWYDATGDYPGYVLDGDWASEGPDCVRVEGEGA